MALSIKTVNLGSGDFNSSGEGKARRYLPDDGLVLNMNANNYASGQTTWFDSMQGITFNSRNSGEPYVTTPTSKVWVEGIPAIAFDGAAWWETNQADANKVDIRGAFTLVLVFWFPANSARKTIFEKAGTSYQSYQQELACTWEVADEMSWYRAGGQDGTYDYAATGGYSRNGWRFIAINGNADHTDGKDYRGNWDNSGYGNRSNTNILRSGIIRIGTGYAGIMQVGYLHACNVWNVELNETRIDQVYNYYSNIFTEMGTTLTY